MMNVYELIGNPGETAAEMANFSADARYFSENYSRLRRKYPDEFVAVKDRKEVGHHENLKGLMGILTEKGVDPITTYIDGVYEGEHPTLILLN